MHSSRRLTLWREHTVCGTGPSAAYPSDYADDSSLARPVDFDKVTDPDEALDRAITANGTTNVLNEYGDVVVIPHKRLGVAAVPTGQDYGPVGNLGLNDKFLIGDSRAFEADSHVYLTLTRNLTGHGSAPTWIMEQLNRDHNLAWGVNVSRFPLRCVLAPCRGSLSLSLSRRHPPSSTRRPLPIRTATALSCALLL